MSAYNIIVNDVQKTENRVLCLARIDNYQNMLKRVSIGESIRTDPFRLDFRNSIGRSSWTLIFYPKGQYIESSNSAVVESGRACMYLKMVHCEHESDSLALTIKFFFKSPYCDVMDEYSITKYATLSYRNLNERWIGPFNMASTNDLYSNRCKNLFLNDSLTVGCELDEVGFRPCLPRPMIWSKENVPTTTARSGTNDRRSLIVGSESNDRTYRPCMPVLQSKENQNTSSRCYTDDKSHVDVKLDNVKRHVKNLSNIDSDFDDTTFPQIGSHVRSKGNPRRATTSDADVIDFCKERKNQKRMSIQESSSALGIGSAKKNEKGHFCMCRNPEKMISKETQTWSKTLRSISEKADGKRSEGADNPESPSCCRVRTKVEFFEKWSSSKD